MKNERTHKPGGIRVECYSGYRGEETPRSFYIDARKIEVETVMDRWLTPDERRFRVKGSDGKEYILRQSIKSDRWDAFPFPGTRRSF